MLPGLDLTRLINLLNPTCRNSLEGAAALCVAESHSQVAHQHLVLKLLEYAESDIPGILRAYDISPELFASDLEKALRANSGTNLKGERPVLSSGLLGLIQESWLIASVELGEDQVRSGAILLAILANPMRWEDRGELARITVLQQASIKSEFANLTSGSVETPTLADAGGTPASAGASGQTGALAQYAIDFTTKAKEGEIDPVFCRDREIRQVIDILGRRRKNNPICVGEAGVGKTAIVEGLARKVAEGDVPDFLKGVHLYGLDMGLLQAGASVRGEFENRLKAVIDEVQASRRPIVMFIDEAHTLIGAGGAQGGSDAANLLKPALARGDFRTIAATTWSEYKKYFEKDPALARRFQLVKLDEPTAADAATIIRGLRPAYEAAHGVYVRDDAVTAAADLSARYLAGRQLPDKAIDVLDTACARVRLSLSSKPLLIDDLERRIASLQRERDARERDNQRGLEGDSDRDAILADELTNAETQLESLMSQWHGESAIVAEILAARRALDDALEGAESDDGAATDDGFDAEGESRDAARDVAHAHRKLVDARTRLAEYAGAQPLVQYEVSPDTVGGVLSDWTGIPLGRMVRDESRLMHDLGVHLRERIRGQDAAVDVIHNSLRTAKANLHKPDGPMGVFCLVGPSGVGKTETALAVADLLFGGDKFLTTINMSEFQEKHTVSRLIGSPPGYVGYGSGGVLTEAVRQRPYSVVLLDEVEKADPEVLNLFYQVFDKGTLADGEGREIDFRNTVIFMTSNLGAADISALARESNTTHDDLVRAVRPILADHFKEALLARMTVVPYIPVQGEVLRDVVRLKLSRLAARVWEHHRVSVTLEEPVVESIAARCAGAESGARTIDHVVSESLLPQISAELLASMAGDHVPAMLHIGMHSDGGFALRFEEHADAVA
jgi:type VI secretion system protein VasG